MVLEPDPNVTGTRLRFYPNLAPILLPRAPDSTRTRPQFYESLLRTLADEQARSQPSPGSAHPGVAGLALGRNTILRPTRA